MLVIVWVSTESRINQALPQCLHVLNGNGQGKLWLGRLTDTNEEGVPVGKGSGLSHGFIWLEKFTWFQDSRSQAVCLGKQSFFRTAVFLIEKIS
jgi:hypothetical protein